MAGLLQKESFHQHSIAGTTSALGQTARTINQSDLRCRRTHHDWIGHARVSVAVRLRLASRNEGTQRRGAFELRCTRGGNEKSVDVSRYDREGGDHRERKAC